MILLVWQSVKVWKVAGRTYIIAEINTTLTPATDERTGARVDGQGGICPRSTDLIGTLVESVDEGRLPVLAFDWNAKRTEIRLAFESQLCGSNFVFEGQEEVRLVLTATCGCATNHLVSIKLANRDFEWGIKPSSKRKRNRYWYH